MFRVNDTVMYNQSGACKIVDICSKEFTGEQRQYYVLQPVYEENVTIYCPVDSEKVKIRKLLSLEDIHELIKLMPDQLTEWIDNDQQRKEAQSEILKNGDHCALIQLVKLLYFKREEKAAEGKKFHTADEKAMLEAEKLLHQEFAIVLNIKPEEVIPFLIGEIEVPDKESKAC